MMVGSKRRKKKPIKNILFVDDEEYTREPFKEALEQFGYEVRVATNGNEALELFLESPADLIITDLFMPEKDGQTFIYEIMQEFPETNIIAITGFDSPYGKKTELKIAKTHGAKRVFTKPVKISELIEAIKELEKN
jgi:CheY-like chemotaxis protein